MAPNFFLVEHRLWRRHDVVSWDSESESGGIHRVSIDEKYDEDGNGETTLTMGQLLRLQAQFFEDSPSPSPSPPQSEFAPDV